MESNRKCILSVILKSCYCLELLQCLLMIEFKSDSRFSFAFTRIKKSCRMNLTFMGSSESCAGTFAFRAAVPKSDDFFRILEPNIFSNNNPTNRRSQLASLRLTFHSFSCSMQKFWSVMLQPIYRRWPPS